jgi:hypothetical protein
LNIKARAQEYKALSEIDSYRGITTRGHTIYETHIYCIEGRRILVKTRTPFKDLDLDNRLRNVGIEDGVKWLGICSLEEATKTLGQDMGLIALILSASKNEPSSPLQALTKLKLRNTGTSLAALKIVLKGCSNLQSLTCTFNRSRGGDSYFTELSELLRTHGSGLHHLRAEIEDADILAFLPHLLICPSLYLRGLTRAKSILECEVPSPITSLTRELVLAPWPLRGETRRLPEPYGWSQRIMDIVPRPCAIYEYNEPGETDLQRYWHSVVRDCLKHSREPDRRKKTDRPGWTKLDRDSHRL